ncbi:uncharacterized protein LOC110251927 [Exaiptasia diaphana]|uniref:Uncharacterized protein n=1 Tax=Exaiptasia diaphana TaxID=2652724 RepID=A0A913YWJ9_EXADI|nr:uncharacterized protein LOC110251927 [Exaiptasia diaphana]
MAKRPWGTIEKPSFGLGYQKADAELIESVVERLSQPKKTQRNSAKSRKRPDVERVLDKDGVQAMVARLANKQENLPKTPDRSRTGEHKKEWGNVLNSYAWHGKNYQAIICGEESPYYIGKLLDDIKANFHGKCSYPLPPLPQYNSNISSCVTLRLEVSIPTRQPLFKMAKKPWGTITHPKERNPDFQMGYQKASSKQIDEMVQRLFVHDYSNRNEKKKTALDRKVEVEPSEFDQNEVDEVVERLTRNAERNVTDAKRTGSMTQQGVCNTFAWKGYN